MGRFPKAGLRLGSSLLALACAASGSGAFAQAAPEPQAAPEAQAASEEDGHTIIVTGVLGATALEDAPISISVITSEELGQQVPASAADILKSVPGVFVAGSVLKPNGASP